MQIEGVGASGGQSSGKLGAGVQVTGTTVLGGAWIPGPNGSFGPSGGVAGSTVTIGVNAGMCEGNWVGMADAGLAGALAAAVLDIKTGAGE